MYYKEERSISCKKCGKVFKTNDVRRKFCGYACANKSKDEKRQKRTKRYEDRNKLKYGISDRDPSVLSYKCRNCGSRFTRYKSQVLKRGVGFCSVDCRVQAQRDRKPTDKMLIDLWSKAVKCYDGHKCAYCGKEQYLNSHHIFSRSNKSTRYDLNNGITLCAGCHTLSSKFSAHKTPVEFVEWIKEKRGEKWYDDLRKRAKKTKKFSAQDLKDIKFNLYEIIDHLSNDF